MTIYDELIQRVSDGETFYINLPKSMNEMIAGIVADARTDQALLDSINSGKEKIKVSEVQSPKLKKMIRVVDFV